MRKLLIVVFAACLSAAAQTAPAKSAPAAAPDKPLQALPYSPSLDLNDMDKSVDPCVDFYTVLLRRLAEEESHSRGPVVVERLRQAVRRQPAVPLGHSRRPLEADHRAHSDAAENRRLLCRLHGRSRSREAWRRAAEAAARRNRRDEIEERPGAAAGQAAARESAPRACCSTSARTRISRTRTTSSPSPTRADSAFPIATTT